MPCLPAFLPRNLQTFATEIEEQRKRIRALEVAVAERRLLEEQRLMKIA
jgi:cell division protein FtsL